jgi:hypothetical protein
MPFCPNCGKEVSEVAVFCPFCGTELAGPEARPITEVKRPLSVTICAILLFISALIHIINMVDFIIIYDLVGSIGQLFFSIFAIVAGCYLWKSKEIGGIIGLAYAILSTIAVLSFLSFFSEWVTIYGLIIDFSLNTAIIILIIVGWKHLKHP